MLTNLRGSFRNVRVTLAPEKFLNEVARRPRIFYGRQKHTSSLRTLSEMPLNKNTSRNQIIQHPTYRRFPINVEEPQSEIYREQEEERRKDEGERAKEREMTLYGSSQSRKVLFARIYKELG